MKISSHSFANGQALPAEFAAGVADGFGRNRNPHLAWDGAPEGTGAFALLCVDPDAPADRALAGKPGVEIAVEQPRTEFVHWVMVDIPATVREIAAGSVSDGFQPGGKRDPAGPPGSRQGVNDYGDWFAGDAQMAGDYLGYDGPYPPPNDRLPHRYFFRLFALDVERLELPPKFTAADALRAMQGHVLAETAIHAVYSLHPAHRR